PHTLSVASWFLGITVSFVQFAFDIPTIMVGCCQRELRYDQGNSCSYTFATSSIGRSIPPRAAYHPDPFPRLAVGDESCRLLNIEGMLSAWPTCCCTMRSSKMACC